MGVTAAVVGGLAGGMALSKAMTPKPPAAAALPDPVATAPKADPVADLKKAQGASDQQKKRTTAAASSASTILTGPSGLGELPAGTGEKKSLLGY